MVKMSLNEIRAKFLEFYREKEHYTVNSYSLVPKNDKSLLLIGAGMAPLKNYFMGIEEPPSKRMATCQKCFRAVDIDNVGYTARHATFFEMLGNFSFGDYFKSESVAWGYEFVTEVLGLPIDKLWVTVYEEDDEAYDIWKNEIGFPEERIVRLGKEHNFWEIGVGPSGPCSEIYFDRGEKFGCGDPNHRPGCDCDQYVEFWNHVFTQFNKDENGEYHLLENKNIDTGMGLERIAAIMQGVDSIFEVDTIRSILDSTAEMMGRKYNDNKEDDISLRIITDHLRAMTFMISDGILPSNESRGYILRKLLRRAALRGRMMGMEKPFLHILSEKVIENSGEAYPNLVERRDFIQNIIKLEEEKFGETIESGLSQLDAIIADTEGQVIDGAKAFKLYDTYGFPLELTEEILETKGLKVDRDAFAREMDLQKERARSARANADDLGWESRNDVDLTDLSSSKFTGYDSSSTETEILALVTANGRVQVVNHGEEVSVVLTESPFYATGGGQVGDKGLITGEFGAIEIENTSKKGDLIIHSGKVIEGLLGVGETVNAEIEANERLSTARNHSATHLLHKALKKVLGDHVNQAGSQVDSEKLRFDFSHFGSISKEDLSKVEQLVNEEIEKGHVVNTELLEIEEAIAKGATALFDEKYDESVRVVSMGDFSMELCGGTHVSNTQVIGSLKIMSEQGIASGVRRIEAITGPAARKYYVSTEELLRSVEHTLKADDSNLELKVDAILSENRELKRELESLRSKINLLRVDELLSERKDMDGLGVIATKVAGADRSGLKDLADKLRDKVENTLIMLFAEEAAGMAVVSTATDDAVSNGVHAGKILSALCKSEGGKGGGRPNFANGSMPTNDAKNALLNLETIIKSNI